MAAAAPRRRSITSARAAEATVISVLSNTTVPRTEWDGIARTFADQEIDDVRLLAVLGMSAMLQLGIKLGWAYQIQNAAKNLVQHITDIGSGNSIHEDIVAPLLDTMDDLAAENSRLDAELNKYVCTICVAAKVTRSFQCGHALCGVCFERIYSAEEPRCPFCRQDVLWVNQLFFS